MPFQWIGRDGKLIIAAREMRSFALGSISVFLIIYLDRIGLTLGQAGIFLSSGIAGSGFFAFVSGLIADKVGRRRLLVTFSTMAAIAALALVFINDFLPLVLFAFLGALIAIGGAAGGPTQPIEQASLPNTAPMERRTDLFAVYRIVSTSANALGALAAGLPSLYQRWFAMSEIAAYKTMFVGVAALILLVALLYSLLSPAVEVDSERRGWVNPLRLPSRGRIFTLTGLFSVDRFAGVLLMQGLVAYWFNTRFDLQLESLAFIFFFSQALAATSLWVAAKLADRIGLINTIVFTHIPSSLFLIGAAFAPTAWMAVVFWLLRSFLGQMDVPTRDSYTMAVVNPEERVAMASIQSVGTNLSATVAPSAATALWSLLSASAPFIACAALKISYDLSLYVMFRNVKPPEEMRTARDSAIAQGKDVPPSTVPPWGNQSGAKEGSPSQHESR